jgi:hypothetical protein
VRVITALVILGGFLAAATRAPASNFGGHYINSSCCLMYGTRADIATPAADFTLAFATFGVVRVSSETPSALIQTGFGQTNGISIDGQCSNTHLQIYWEYLLPNVLPGVCSFIGSPGYGTVHKYSTFRASSMNTMWDAAVDGVVKVAVDLRFSTSEDSVSGGEIAGTGATASGHLYGCYGCNGNLAWQRATAPASAAWTTIQSSNPLNDDGRWTIGTTPSPFSVSHPYP